MSRPASALATGTPPVLAAWAALGAGIGAVASLPSGEPLLGAAIGAIVGVGAGYRVSRKAS